MNQTVAVFGATGAQGGPVVEKALAAGMRVRAVARDADKIARVHPDAEAAAADLANAEAIASTLDGVDAAFVHLPMPSGPDDARSWLDSLLTAAERAALPFLVFTTSGPTGARYPSSMVVDGNTAAAAAIRDSIVPSIILQPAVYLENLQPELFLPRLRTEGILDYPPLPANLKVMWTSHLDQAAIATAALSRPDLAGTTYDIGSPDAITGPDLAALLGRWLGRPVRYAPLSPEDFGQRVGHALGSPGAAFALNDLYSALGRLGDGDMVVDIAALETVFATKLTPIADHIGNWTARD